MAQIPNGPLSVLVVVLALYGWRTPTVRPESPIALEYRAASPDNPLKGLVPYFGQGIDDSGKERFPHSLEFWYFPLSELMTGEDQFDWEPIESRLRDVAQRGHQLVIRVFLEYPGKREGVPAFLVDQGLKIHEYLNSNTAPLPPATVRTPDWEDPRLRSALQSFIAAFGARYDGDPRIGYITAGLLGTWGEWHDYPRTELWASKTVQREVLEAYQQHFRRTPILLRYPTAGEPLYAMTSDLPFGYHDDSFGWATVETGRSEDDWFFARRLRDAGELNKWQTAPVGGEIRPEVWGCIFDPQPCTPPGQDFSSCLAATHASWLMETGLFTRPLDEERRAQAVKAVQRMGYDLWVSQALVEATSRQSMSVSIQLRNRGVAPFYRDDYRLELGLFEGQAQPVHAVVTDWRLTGVLPEVEQPEGRWLGPFVIEISDEIRQSLGHGQRISVGLRTVPPFQGGTPVRFANQAQDAEVPGWLMLGSLSGLEPGASSEEH